MNQQRNNGGGNRAQRMNNQRPEMTKTEKLAFVLTSLKDREEEVSGVLPPDMPFDKFHATINQALRTDPDILTCTPLSIVNACIEAAFDGLRLDGKEAALVAHNVKVATNPDRWEEQAEYFPMVYGLVKQILMSGEVTKMHIDVIHENDKWRVLSGSDPRIEHEPYALGDRGGIIMAYSIATMKNGEKSQEVMYLADLAAVRAAAKTQFVWNKWPGEMSKKSAARRHKKRLPSGREWRDAEAARMFPQFQQQAPALEDHRAAPSRPTRQQALSDDRGPVFNDFGNGDRDGGREMVEQQVDQQRDQGQRQQAEKERRDEQLPADDVEWGVWICEVEAQVAKSGDVDALGEYQQSIMAAFGKAPKDVKDRASMAFSNRAADLAAGPDDATARDDGHEDDAGGA